mgnify:CR=1 FL=1
MQRSLFFHKGVGGGCIVGQHCVAGVGGLFVRSVVGIKKLPLGMSLVPVNFGVTPLGSRTHYNHFHDDFTKIVIKIVNH